MKLKLLLGEQVWFKSCYLIIVCMMFDALVRAAFGVVEQLRHFHVGSRELWILGEKEI